MVTVYVMVAPPPDIPVNTPVVGSIVATEDGLQLQVPPGTVDERVVDAPEGTSVSPVIVPADRMAEGVNVIVATVLPQ